MIQHSFKWQPSIYLFLLLTVLFSACRTPITENTRPPIVDIQYVENLQKSGLKATSDCKPLLLEFSASYCSFCKRLEEEVLKPILRNREYDARVLIEQVKMDNYLKFTGFSGDKTDAETLSKKYSVWVTPTLLFLDSEGNEIAERMVGVNTLEYFGAYLDESLETARQTLIKKNRCSNSTSFSVNTSFLSDNG